MTALALAIPVDDATAARFWLGDLLGTFTVAAKAAVAAGMSPEEASTLMDFCVDALGQPEPEGGDDGH